MRVPGVIATAAGTGIVGYIAGRLTSADLRHLLEKLLDTVSAFLHEQGPYVAYALVMAACFGLVAIWSIRQLIRGKQGEIERLVVERDRFQTLFIDDWQSSRKKNK